MLYLLIIFLVALVCFIQRLRFRMKVHLYGIDTWFHLTVSERIRKNKGKLPKSVGFSVPSQFAYPPLLHYIVALFKPEKQFRYNKYFTPFFDAVHAFILMFFVYWVDANVIYGASPVLASVIVGGIFILAPYLWAQTVNLNPRPLGFMFTSIIYMSFFMYLTNFNIIFLFTAIAFIMLVFMTHKFAIQAVTFLNIGLSIILMNPIFVLAELAAFFLIIALTKGFYLKVLRGHIQHANWWRKALMGGMFDERFEGGLVVRIKRVVLDLLSRNFWLIPFYLVIIASLYSTGDFLPPAFAFGNLDMFFWSAIVLTVMHFISSTKHLGFLGENYRYTGGYLVLPLAVLLSLSLSGLLSNPPYFGALDLLFLAACIGVAVISAFLIYTRMKEMEDEMSWTKPDKDLLECYEFIRKSDGEKLLCTAVGMNYSALYFTKKKTVGRDTSVASEEMLDFYPRLRHPPKVIAEKYGADLIISPNFTREEAGGYTSVGKLLDEYDFSFADEVFRTEKYTVYRVRKQPL